MFRRRRDAGDLVDEMLAGARLRLHDRFDNPAAAVVAYTDQLESGLRSRLTECGIDPTDDVVRATLLIVADTFVVSHGRLPLTCVTALQFWSVTAQFALAVIQLDEHGASPC